MYELNCIFHQNIGKAISCEQPIIALDSFLVKSSISSTSVSSLVLFRLSLMAIISLFPRRPTLPPEPRVFTFNHGMTRHLYCLNCKWMWSYIFYILSQIEKRMRSYVLYIVDSLNGYLFFIFSQWTWSYQVTFSSDPKPSEGDKRQWNLPSVILYGGSSIHDNNHHQYEILYSCRPAQLAELPRSEFDPELFSHSTYVKFFVTFVKQELFNPIGTGLFEHI